MTRTVGSLFAGIGGFDLGLERAGFDITWQVEIDPYCTRVLAKHWPAVRRYGDIKSIDWSGVEPVDLICGGFPCQPFSLAGKRQGQKDDRYLWPDMLRAITQVRPTWVIAENVPGLIGSGLDTVLVDLEGAGYAARTLVVPACAVGAPHRRDRVWILATHAVRHAQQQPAQREHEGASDIAGRDAHKLATGPDVADAGRLNGNGWQGQQESTDGETAKRSEAIHHAERCGEVVAHADSQRLQERGIHAVKGTRVSDSAGSRGSGEALADAEGEHVGPVDDGEPTAVRAGTQKAQGRRDAVSDGHWWAVEPDVGRVAHGISKRVDRLRGLGNAVVPQVVEWLGRQILAHAAMGHA